MKTPMTGRPHEIRIEHLVLPPGTVGTRRVRAALERELARLVAAEPAAGDAAVPAANVRVETGADASDIGAAVARQVHNKAKRP